MYLQRDGYLFGILHLTGNCLFQQDPWGMVSQAERCWPILLQILPGMERHCVLQHRNGRMEERTFESLCFNSHTVLLSSWSKELSSCGSSSFKWTVRCSHFCASPQSGSAAHCELKHNPLFSFACGSQALAMSSPTTKASWSPVQLQLVPT